MSVFGEWAGKYFELGINVIPIYKDKRPPKGFQYKKWLQTKQTEVDVDDLIFAYGNCPGIAVVCGEVSGIVGFDFDYKYDERKFPPQFGEKKWKTDCSVIERDIKNTMPEWALAKKGVLGWTSFYRWNSGMRSLACDRNGVRLFDFKATGYIVIPPSFHSIVDGESKYYSWIYGEPMDDFSDLPDLDFAIIKDLSEAWGEKKSAAALGNNRHAVLFRYVMDLLKVESDKSVVLKKLIQYDLRRFGSHEKGPYLNDRRHCPQGPEKYAEAWIDRISNYSGNNRSEAGSQPVGDEAWNHFFETSFHDVRKDILSEKVMTKRDEISPWVPIEALDGVLRSYACEKGLSKHMVNDEISRFIYEKKELSFLCDLPPYDGKDWVQRMAECLVSDEFSCDEISLILKHWGSGIFSRIDDSNNQNRCVIFKGPQGIGKDEFIKAMVRDFSSYYQMVTPPSQNKDWLEIVSRLYICHIEEFDQTAKVDMAFLKSLITQPSSFFRESYGRNPIARKTAVSFISSVNPDDFFRDPTGNRRFLVIPLRAIKFNYPRYNSAQVLSQFQHIYKTEGRQMELPIALEAKIKAFVDGLTPEGNEDLIVDIWSSRAENLVKKKMSFSSDGEIFKIDQDTAATVFHDIAKTVGVTPAKVRRILKTKGFQGRDSISRWWTSRPMIDIVHH